MTALRKLTQEVTEALQRMTHLSQGPTETTDGKKDDKYFESHMDLARSFLSVLPGAVKLLAQGEVKREAIQSRLRDERQGMLLPLFLLSCFSCLLLVLSAFYTLVGDSVLSCMHCLLHSCDVCRGGIAWSKVYSNVAGFMVHQLGRRLALAQQALQRTSLTLESLQVYPSVCHRRFVTRHPVLLHSSIFIHLYPLREPEVPPLKTFSILLCFVESSGGAEAGA